MKFFIKIDPACVIITETRHAAVSLMQQARNFKIAVKWILPITEGTLLKTNTASDVIHSNAEKKDLPNT